MIRFFALVLLFAGIGSLAFAQSYTVSSDRLSAGYSDLSRPTLITYSRGNELSSTIAPSGFSFSYFGQTFTDFKVGANGYILMDSSSTIETGSPSHASAPGYVISPCWVDLDPNGNLAPPLSSTQPPSPIIGYLYDSASGVLSVEWNNIPTSVDSTVGVRMQCIIDTANGTIEYRYGTTPTNTSGVTGNASHMVAISGASSAFGASQEIIDGEDSGNVTASGAVQSYPVNRYIRFTPAASSPNNAPTIAVSMTNGVTAVLVPNGSDINVDYNDTVQSLGLGISVSDSDGDQTSLSATVTSLGSTGIDTTEWESAAAPVSYILNPSSGTFNTVAGATHSVTLTADDGQDTTTFTFDIVQAPAAPGIEVSDSGGAISPGDSASGTARDFGSQDTGSGPTAQITITITNSGQADLTLQNLGITGTDAGEFILDTSSFGGTVVPGTSTSFGLEFDPSSAGSKTATVTFEHNDAGVTNPFTFEIVGTGTTPAPAPILLVQEGGSSGATISHGSGPGGQRDFGTRDTAAGPTTALVIHIQNNGNADLTLGTPTVNSGEFVVDDTGMATTLTQGTSTSFTVAFDPASPTTTVATVSFTHNDGTVNDPFEFDVRGTGTTAGGSGGGGSVGGGSGGGGGGCAASHGESHWMLILALGAILGAWHLRRRAV